MGYSGSKKPGGTSSGTSGDSDSPMRRFLARPMVTVSLGAAIGLLVIAGAVWALSSPGDGSDDAAGDAAASAEASQETTSGPRMELDTESIDLGRITQDDTVKKTITVTNSGDELLIIRDVDAS